MPGTYTSVSSMHTVSHRCRPHAPAVGELRHAYDTDPRIPKIGMRLAAPRGLEAPCVPLAGLAYELQIRLRIQLFDETTMLDSLWLAPRKQGKRRAVRCISARGALVSARHDAKR